MDHSLKKIPKIISLLNENLIENKVRFIHWKSNIHLINGLVGETDLDVLIHPEDKLKFELIAKESLFTQVSSPSWCNYPYIDDFIGSDSDSGTMIHLHVHYRLLTGFKRVKHFHIPFENQILDARIYHKETNWPTPSYVDEFIVFIVRIQLKSRLISFFSRKSFYPETIKTEYSYLSKLVEKKQIIDRLAQLDISLTDIDIDILLAGSSYDDIKAIGNKIISQIRNGYRHRFASTLLISFFQGVLYWNARRLHRKGKLSRFKKTIKKHGLTVAFIGVDGSGKSTVTQSIYDWLIPKVDVHLVYLGSGDGKKGTIEKMRSGLRKKSPISKSNNTYFRVLIRSFFDASLIIRKTFLIYKSKKMSRKGSVIIMDRFPQDQFFGINDGPKIPKLKSLFLLRLVEKYCFKVINTNNPDVVVRLDVDYATSIQRKPDHLPSLINEKIKQIEKIYFENTQVIDSKQNLDSVLLETKRLIWNKILDKQKK